MISVQSGMLVILGFLIASLLALLLASAFWSRAVRLTTRRLKQSMPVSESEIRADLDRLRASHAIKVHKLETQLGQAKFERARQLIEINRRDASISALETDVVTIKAELDENLNARRVLEQTIADRLPKVEARLAEAKRLLFNRDREIAELAQGARRHKAALEEASSINAQRSAEIERLSNALTTRGKRRHRIVDDAGPEGEVALRAEAETLRAKTREQAMLIDRLQRRFGEGYVVAVPVASSSAGDPAAQPPAAESKMERLRESLADAETVLHLARTGAPVAETGRLDQDRELRTLRAHAEDQAGEIARLKAALAAFEQSHGGGAGFKMSRLALRARAGSAEAHAERQAATISRLRAELAAAHERLARQAAHFMDEMRRVGAGTPASGQARRPLRDEHGRRLAEGEGGRRVPADAATGLSVPPVDADGQLAVTGKGAGNGGGAPEAVDAKPPAPPGVPTAPAETATMPAERRKVRLLDRITGIGKN